MAVGYVTYQRLTPATKSRVRDLLKLNPDYPRWEIQIPANTSVADHDMMIFEFATTWADDIKVEMQYSDDGFDGGNRPNGASSSQNIGYGDLLRHQYWHFVNTPFSSDGTSLPSIPTPNAVTQIGVIRKVLASSESDGLKSYDLVWLLHLIGDVHQPLHAATRVSRSKNNGDAGGNRVTLTGDADSNLHAYWDNLPGSDCKFCNDKASCLNRAIVFASNLKPVSRAAARNTETAAWLKESFDYARSKIYQAPIGTGDGPYTIVPLSSYDFKAYRLAQKRIALAGARLAWILNSELR